MSAEGGAATTRRARTDPAHHKAEVFHTDCVARDVVGHVTSRWGVWVLVWRRVEPTTPPQVTYGLTELGRDIGEPLTARGLAQSSAIRASSAGSAAVRASRCSGVKRSRRRFSSCSRSTGPRP